MRKDLQRLGQEEDLNKKELKEQPIKSKRKMNRFANIYNLELCWIDIKKKRKKPKKRRNNHKAL